MGTKKKICFVVAVPMTASAFLLKHIETLAQEFDVYLVANFEGVNSNLHSNPHLKGIFSAGIQRDIEYLKDYQALVSLTRYFRKMEFDAVLTVTPKAGLLGILAAYYSNIPHRIHIFTGQVWHTKTGIFKKILMFIDQMIFKMSTQVLVDGNAQLDFLAQSGIINKERARVLGKGSISGVDAQKFNPDDAVRTHWRKELNYTDDQIVFMFLGRLNLDKGIMDLARAFQLLHKEHPQARLLLVGYDEENLMPQINQLGMDPASYHFFGPTSKPNELLQASDVFCLPSYREGFGTSIIEASLLEKPILCSDTYGLKETIIDDVTGLRHKTGDVNSILNQMKTMVNEPTHRTTMGKEGRRYILENFTAEKISGAWLEFFGKLLK
ncbi:MAG TPA: glycosyltransferase [Catalimonadaceae bacterium]|nr:glycosyltransferase [Catalimonadaceae bacterium]HPI09970.1 glycosyltransferase [Catalimonadaceae bacterium]